MFILNCLLFYIIWVMLVNHPIPSFLVFAPFTRYFKDQIRFKKYKKPLFLTMIFTYLVYVKAIFDYVLNLHYAVAFSIIFFTILFIINYFVLKFIGFIDYLLRSKKIDELLCTFCFYFLYFSYLVLIFLTSMPIVKLTYKLFGL